MSDFLSNVETMRDRALNKLRDWEKQKAAREVMREYLSEEGMLVKSNSKLNELLDARHQIALQEAHDPEVRLKAINASLEMAAGNEKVTNVQNNQFNFGKFLNDLPEE